MTNYDIADYFSLLSKLMDIHDEDSFKVKSYSIAAYNIERLPAEVEEMDDNQLYSMKGIGKSIGTKIREVQRTGKLEMLEDFIAKTPSGILEIMRIKGLGPKKIGLIWKEMGVESIGELEYACNENRLVLLKGFGAKTQQAVLENIQFIKQSAGSYLWAEAEVAAKQVMHLLNKHFPGNAFLLTGEFLRQNEIINVIDIVTDVSVAQLKDYFLPSENTVFTEESDGSFGVHTNGLPRLRFLFAELEKLSATQFLHSGSEEFINAFTAQYSTENITSEEAIFTNNNLQYVPAALRESVNIISKAAQNNIPQLIQAADIKGIIHSHSKWSDGNDSLEAMAKAAKEKGFEYLVMSDHSQSAFYAEGLKPDRVAAQHIEIDALNAKLAPFKIFKSIESDILYDGSLDYSENVLATFDLVIASVHSNLKMNVEKSMTRLLRAIENPYTTILGHPTGRLLLSRNGYSVDHKMIIDACAANNVVIEINAHPRRLDIDWRWIDYAINKGVILSIDPDAHSIAGFDDIRYGVLIGQKGGLTAANNLSSMSLTAFEQFVSSGRAKRPVF